MYNGLYKLIINFDGESKYFKTLREKWSWTVSHFKIRNIEVRS